MRKINTKSIALIAMGIALYAVLSMTVKIPLVGHIAVDLGYIVLGVYCYCFGWLPGTIVGGAGAAIISTLTGWFAPGWMLGNALIGFICGKFYTANMKRNVVLTIVAVFLGIAGVKTVVDCALYQTPFALKLYRDCIASISDSLFMIVGLFLAPRFKKKTTDSDLSRYRSLDINTEVDWI